MANVYRSPDLSRSRHTDPWPVLAERRVRRPWAPRSEGVVDRNIASPLPRLTVVRARPGHFHPLDRADLQRALRLLGTECTYGLQEVRLASQPHDRTPAQILFGRLLAPGCILLYEQAEQLWMVPDRMSGPVRQRFMRAGAIVELGISTTITWPQGTLRSFFLADILPHEVAHHMLQHYGGKRTIRLARTADQEARAEVIAERLGRRLLPLLTTPG